LDKAKNVMLQLPAGGGATEFGKIGVKMPKSKMGSLGD
jgi:hypothetical protein